MKGPASGRWIAFWIGLCALALVIWLLARMDASGPRVTPGERTGLPARAAPTLTASGGEPTEDRAAVVPGSEARSGLSIRGHVLGEGARGLEGAHVSIAVDEGALANAPVMGTGSRGAFTMGVPDVGPFVVRAQAPGYAVSRRPGVWAGQQIDVQLMRVVTLEVRVEDAVGLPVEGAEVVLHLRSLDARHAETALDGTVAFPGLPGGAAGVVTAVHVRHGSIAESLRSMDRGSRGPVVLRFPRGRDVRGTVVSAEGSPIAGARLTSPTLAGVLGRSDAEGRFTVHGWVDRPMPLGGLQATAAGYAGRLEDPTGQDEVAFVLPIEARVTVLVTDQEGDRPVAGVRLKLEPGLDHPYAPLAVLERAALTNGKGAAVFAGLTSGKHYRVFASARGWAGASEDFARASGDEEPVRLRLTRGATVTGTARKADGTALPDVHVTLEQKTEPGGAATVLLGAAARGGPRKLAALSDAVGRFQFAGVRTGRHRLQARDTGGAWSGSTLVDAAPGPPIEQDVVLEHVGWTLDVVVRDPAGVGVAGCVVGLRGAGRATRTDEAGHAHLVVVPGRRSLVVAGAPLERLGLLRPRPIPLDEAHPSLIVELERAVAIVGDVVDRDGQGISDAEITVEGGGGPAPEIIFADAAGRFTKRVREASPGKLTFTLTGAVAPLVDGHRVRRLRGLSGSVVVEGPPAGRVRLVAARAEGLVSLAVVVRGPEGEPQSGVRVSLLVGREITVHRADEQGHAVFSGLPDGAHFRVLARPGQAGALKRGWLASRPVSGETVRGGPPVELRLRQAVRLTGRVALLHPLGTDEMHVLAVGRHGAAFIVKAPDTEGHFALWIPREAFPVRLFATTPTAGDGVGPGLALDEAGARAGKAVLRDPRE